MAAESKRVKELEHRLSLLEREVAYHNRALNEEGDSGTLVERDIARLRERSATLEARVKVMSKTTYAVITGLVGLGSWVLKMTFEHFLK